MFDLVCEGDCNSRCAGIDQFEVGEDIQLRLGNNNSVVNAEVLSKVFQDNEGNYIEQTVSYKMDILSLCYYLVVYSSHTLVAIQSGALLLCSSSSNYISSWLQSTEGTIPESDCTLIYKHTFYPATFFQKPWLSASLRLCRHYCINGHYWVSGQTSLTLCAESLC